MDSHKQRNSTIPPLRFPEFHDCGEWEVAAISNILSYERPEKYIVKSTIYEDYGTPVLTANKSFILGYIEENKNICTNIPVILFDDFTTDKKYVDFPFCIKSSALKLLRAKGDNNLKFAFELISTIKFEAKEHKRYYISEYQNIKIPIPKPSEQHHIAKFLSSLDSVIELTIKKKNKLIEYKRYLYLQLFPQNNLKFPSVRFPEFSKAPAWNSRPLEDIVTTVSPPAKIQTKDYLQQGKYPIIDQSVNRIAGWTNEENAVIRGISKENPVIVFGDHTCIVKLITFEFAQGADGIKILKPKSNVVAKYLYQYLLANPINDNEYKRHFSALKELLIYYPTVDSGEQQKIAECFLSLDNLISATLQKINSLKELKIGLMQQVFPQL